MYVRQLSLLQLLIIWAIDKAFSFILKRDGLRLFGCCLQTCYVDVVLLVM